MFLHTQLESRFTPIQKIHYAVVGLTTSAKVTYVDVHKCSSLPCKETKEAQRPC